ncbi:serine/threonine-protein phosphatase [Amycolatopsis rubida]|uniref:Serine/threonine-protein phosphatase n=1 Tax=Amycolatopsis rubida TaxID=112413 RepID=A0ABX0BSX3_9PSEU|nr:hypothetical protein [Amycolatopsis rubida]NEC58732.1 serine/threonine-protein phosphatase [Amycolatopsis rubida]OAP22927.1 PP2C-family Ser/Thr phosphatase [Amycolatopsis sp. M39]
MTLMLSYAVRTDRGLVRTGNEDAVYAGRRLLAVADGVGGHTSGEIASTAVIAALAALDHADPGRDPLGALTGAVETGNAAIRDLVARDRSLAGMGTTLTAVLFAGDRLAVVNIGDSRTYLVREGNCTQLTHDDSLVQQFVDAGRITAEQARHHPRRSIILRALTGGLGEHPSASLREARAGDRYLLCSDGLSDVVDDGTIAETLRAPDLEACADRLVELALDGGGPDNVTVVVADVRRADRAAPIVRELGNEAGVPATRPLNGLGRRRWRTA